jgi:cytidine deaminase
MTVHSRKFSDLAAPDRLLIEAALDVSANAYAPYSGFSVGAAARAKSGAVYLGANLENASYGLGMCAEVAAITHANSSGDYKLEAIAIIGHKFTAPRNITQVVTPCGRCRQLIFEAGQIAQCDVTIFSCSGDRQHILESKISDFLPEAFGPKNLGLERAWPQMQADLRRSIVKLKNETAATSGPYPRSLRKRSG